MPTAQNAKLKTRSSTLLALLLVIGACAGDEPVAERDVSAGDTGDGECGREVCAPAPPTLGEPTQVVPGSGLPEGLEILGANNNLDVVEHGGRIYLAFRTAPNHFASDEARLHVLSSVDQVRWDLEATIARGTDLREPRFLSWSGRLFLYFAVLGTNPMAFEPQGTMVTELEAPGRWDEAGWILEEGFIPWRTRVVDGMPYLLAYVGGENIYELDGEPVEVHWLTTSDGRRWEAVVPGQPVVLRGGSSETDFVFLDDGSLVAVSRNELGDELGFGSKICRAQPESLGLWDCVGDPRKYDSPLLFRQGAEVYLIGRRNLSETGNFDLGHDNLGRQQQNVQYQLDYWNRPKRCSLWRVDPERLEVDFVIDLPSRGDTCFPGILPVSDHEFVVYNYTSPLDGPDVSWLQGQTGPTAIYRIDVHFEPAR